MRQQHVTDDSRPVGVDFRARLVGQLAQLRSFEQRLDAGALLVHRQLAQRS
jgi:hypothetical protein